MSKSLRFVVVFGAIVGALIGVVHVQPSWAASLSMEWWSLRDLEQTIEGQLRLTVELEAQREQAARRAELRRHIVAEVVADRVTLLEAAIEFRRINQTLPSTAYSYQHAYSAKSEGESLCRYVIRLTQVYMSERTPNLVQARTEQLNRELQALVGQDGIVHLPDE